MREAKRIIGAGKILVDQKPRKSHKFPCGFMDVVSIPLTKENFRILLDARGILRVVPISEKDAGWKFCRIENKKTVKGGKIQLNLHDGRNILDGSKYSTGDVVKISLPDQEIIDSFPMKEGNVAMIIGGKHAGEIATIESIEITKNPKPNIVHLENFTTIKEYVFPVGREKAEIEVPKMSII
jgi:small subunit ribosomal protein S4e